jgi:uncharacterized DUF497 family protein
MVLLDGRCGPFGGAVVAARWILLVVSACAILAGCATQETGPPPVKPEQVPGKIVQLLPPTLPDRTGWAADIYAAFSTQGITPSTENLCAVLAITEQESSFRADPAVPGLAEIAWREIDHRAERAGVPKFAVRAALQLSSPDGRTYSERIDAVKTERELSEIYEDFIAGVPMGTTLFAKHNPIRTGGPMQVGVSFAEACEIFGDDHASCVPDPVHSVDEQRYLLFGATVNGRHLVVSYTERGDTIRLISARPMTASERRAYEQ